MCPLRIMTQLRPVSKGREKPRTKNQGIIKKRKKEKGKNT